ncbi:MAG TPA: alanine--tRNA ligase [Phycisphaerales bacterium]|nr:alanine--tRNA ligase [Phycisphaerales bacterium]HMP36805.1 alanine--tRNA ligase [Phycisphaerales bacterium]
MTRSAAEIRRTFLEFFEKRCGHVIVPSAPVVPHDDPTLLFTNAGMNQFKDVFLGRGTRPYTRAVDTQKCIRAGGKHNDLEDVGKDSYHHTFFEMLGNWSFGDYFKAESIEWGWTLLVEVFGIEPSRLYATWFRGDPAAGLEPDEEARQLWLRHLPESRVLPGSMKDNFWEMGETGPCGPCSEIHYDRIGGRDASALVNAGDPDVLEIWNHVFIQFNRESGGTLRQLPARHVDTGMGLERLVSVLQDRRSNYDTDLFTPIFAAIRERTGARAYGGGDDTVDVAYRVIADHIRCLVVAITDGAAPSSEGRGYVLRRILRRAVRHGHQTLGMREPFLADLVPAVLATLGDVFPELRAKPERVASALRDEEEAFGRTLDRGLALFSEAAGRARSGVVAAEDAFRLHDTFGFPIDLTQVMAAERSLSVDLAGYEAMMERAREASRRTSDASPAMTLPPDALARLRHMGINPTNDEDKYHGRPIMAEVKAIWNGRDFDNHADLGRTVALILDRTNHYAEAGGQLGDQGRLRVDLIPGSLPIRGLEGTAQRGGSTFEVRETHAVGEFVLHVGHLSDGTLRVGERGALAIERDRREALRANHTATHLVNHALREILGETEQRGSLVATDRLRFDFASGHALAPESIERLESIVNAAVAADSRVFADVVPLGEARAIAGVRAVFGERYPDPVRVVSVGAPIAELLADPANPRWMSHAIEFCGGTHVESTGEIRRFVLLSEGALSAGVRRIFGLTGAAALAAEAAGHALEQRALACEHLNEEFIGAEFDEIAPQADALPMSAVARRRVHAIVERLRERVRAIRKREQGAVRERIVEQSRQIAERATSRVIVHELDSADRDVLMAGLDAIRARRADAAVLLLGTDFAESRVTIVASVPPELVKAGLKAGEWVKDAASACGGSGGGRPDSAQAGGKEPHRAAEALMKAATFAGDRLGAAAR